MSSTWEPITPQARARRKRQNRIIIAIVIMVAVPVLVVTLTNQYIEYRWRQWSGQQTYPINETFDVYIKASGDRVIWAFIPVEQCSVVHNSQEVSVVTPRYQPNEGGFYRSGEFTAPEAGWFQVECTVNSEYGYLIISGESPLSLLTNLAALSVSLVSLAILTGVVMLIVSLVQNSQEKNPPHPPP
ncbi:MAG: hypothetical protein FWD55_00625, partial [Propionibacteriaceae bacterium]|nr:hypothetical protein [Propionibacteriaceae bacterium]